MNKSEMNDIPMKAEMEGREWIMYKYSIIFINFQNKSFFDFSSMDI